MSLSSSLFSGISGLSTLGNAMTVIGDNIANVNTVGFKASRVTFQDVFSQTVSTTAGTAQVGRGTSLADISASFAQGSFESTENPTDLAIGGEGFFIVNHPENVNDKYYARAGEFRFDKDGNLVSPAGFIVNGWKLNEETGDREGDITSMVLDSFTSKPQKTKIITLINNLDSQKNTLTDNLEEEWDGTDTDADGLYIANTMYEYQSTVKVYDAQGRTHDITIYYDKGASSSTWEYIVVANPTYTDGSREDTRSCVSATDKGIGMLGKGAIAFDTSSGEITDINFSKFIGDEGGLSMTTQWDTNSASVTTTVYGEFSSTGTGTYTFTEVLTTDTTIGGASAASLLCTASAGLGSATATITIPANYTSGTVLGSAAGMPDGVEVAFAFSGATGTIDDADTMVVTVAAGDANDLSDTDAWATMIESTDDLSGGYFAFTADFLEGTGTSMDVKIDFGATYNSSSGTWVPDSLSTTQFAASSTTIFQSSDGYGKGDLQSVMVDTDGVLTGQYSNGEVIQLYQVALAKFNNDQGLFKMGGNLFRETRLSGDPIPGVPGTNGLGYISPNSLEQSNVDIANEFVRMITTQRGFQANSKIITVTDQMLAELIALKR